MNTLIPNLSKPYLLDEFLSESNFTVHLFSNNIVGDEDPIVFIDPIFDGYNPIVLNNNKWNVSTLNVNYATCSYSETIIFNNLSNNNIEQIYGYYVKNSNGENLWYEKFNTPKNIGVEEGLGIKITVNLNKPGGGFNFVSFILNSADDTPIKSSSLSILSENWNEKSIPNSLVDITNKNFKTNNSIYTLLLKPDIVPSNDYPYSFTYLIESYGFNNLLSTGHITRPGISSFEITLTPQYPPPTKPPEIIYSTGDDIVLNGPFDTKVGLTFSSAEPNSSFSFKYLSNSEFSFPANMMIYINNVLLASVDYFTSYNGQNFVFTYQSYVLTGTFTDPKFFFTVSPPGPTPPEQG